MPIIPSGMVDISFCALLYGSGDPYFGPELSFCISTMSFSLLYPHFPIDLPLSHLNPALVARVLIPSPRASHFRFLFYCCLLQITLSTTFSLALEPSIVFSYKISLPPRGPSLHIETPLISSMMPLRHDHLLTEKAAISCILFLHPQPVLTSA